MADKIEIVIQAKDETTAATKSASASLDGLVKKAAGLVAAKVGFDVLKEGVFGSIDAASDLNESMSKTQVVFGSSAGAIQAFASTAATQLGISKQAALEATGTFGNLFVSMGLGQQPSADLSQNIVKLASDLASFNNLNPDDVLLKLRSGLVGETEPLRDLGINISAAAVQAKAMQMGLADANGEVSQAALIQARYALIMEQSTTAQGDFSRTSSGLANSQRILHAELTNLSATIGTVLLPVVTQIVGTLTTVLNVFSALPGPVQFAIVAFVALAAAAASIAIVVGPLVGLVTTLLPVFGAIAAVLTGPVILAIVGVVAVLAGFYLAWQTNFLGIRDLVASAWSTIGPVFDAIGARISAFAATVLPELLAAWSTVQAGIEAVVGVIQSIVTAVFGAIAGFLSDHGAQIQAILSAAWSAIQAVVESATAIISNVIQLALNLISGNWSGAWDNVQNIGQAAWSAIQAVVSAGIAIVQNLVQIGLDALQALWSAIWNALPGVVSAAWGLVQAAVSAGIGAIQGAFAGAGSWLLQAGRDIVQGLINGIGSMVQAAVGKAQEVASSVKHAVTGFLGIHSPSKVMAEVGKDTILGLVAGMDDAQQDAAKKAADVAKSIADALSSGLKFAQDAASFTGPLPGADFIAALADRTQIMTQALGDSAATMTTDFLTAAKAYADAAKEGWSALGSGLSFAADVTKALAGGDITLPSDDLISGLKFKTEHMVKSLGDSAALMTADFVAAAKDYAGAAKSGWDALGGGLAFAAQMASALKDGGLTLPTDQFITDLKFLTEHAVQSLGDSAALMSGPFLDGAKAFSSAGKAAFDALGGVVTFLTDLDKIKDINIDASVKQLTSFLIEFSVQVTQAFAASAGRLSTESLDAASGFADAAKSVFDAIKPATDAIDGLVNMSVLTDSMIQRFLDNLSKAFSAIASLPDAASLPLKQAQAFAQAAKSIADALQSGIDVLKPFGVSVTINGVTAGASATGSSKSASRTATASGTFNPYSLPGTHAFTASVPIQVNVDGTPLYSKVQTQQFQAMQSGVSLAGER